MSISEYLHQAARQPLPFDLYDSGVALASGAVSSPSLTDSLPLISCLMVSRGELIPARYAIECFLRQSYSNCELVIVSANPNTPLPSYCANLHDARIRFHAACDLNNLGALRNRSVQLAQGDWLCVWDDDDIYHPDRLRHCYIAALAFNARAVFLRRCLLWAPHVQALVISSVKIWENSMLTHKDNIGLYPELHKSEDTVVMERIWQSSRVVLLDAPWLYTYNYTGFNTWDVDHFQRFYDWASVRESASAYPHTLQSLDAVGPYLRYAADLRQRQAELQASA